MKNKLTGARGAGRDYKRVRCAAFRPQNPVLYKIRVVMFSSSDEPRDINQAYELGTNSYSVKPMHFEDLVRVVDLLSKHWLGLSRSPDCTA